MIVRVLGKYWLETIGWRETKFFEHLIALNKFRLMPLIKSNVFQRKACNTTREGQRTPLWPWRVRVSAEKLVFASLMSFSKLFCLWNYIKHLNSVSSQHPSPRILSKMLRCALCFISFLSVWFVMEHSVSCCHITLNPWSPKSVKQQPIRYRLIFARAWPTSADTGIAPKSDILIGLCLTHWALGRHLLFGLSLAGGSSFSVW